MKLERRDVLGRLMTRVHVATYAAVHLRLGGERGSCVRCDSPAEEWALKHDASERLHDKDGRIFSTHETDYEPLCVKCHRRGDGNSQTMWNRHHDYLVSKQARGEAHGCSKLKELQVMQIKEQRAAGVKLWKLSSDYGVSMAQISRIAQGKSWRGAARKSLKGFSLIELMIVVAILGILAAIALPAYQDYVVRSKMSEALAAIAACKTAVAEYASVKAVYPPNATDAGCSTQATKYVESLIVTDGVIEAKSLGTGAKPAECVLSLAPPAGGATAITAWTGTFSGCAAKYVPSSFR